MFDETVKADMTLLSYMKEMGKNGLLCVGCDYLPPPPSPHPSATHPSTTHPSTTHPSTTHPSTTHPSTTHPSTTPQSLVHLHAQAHMAWIKVWLHVRFFSRASNATD